jgi:hypothetical protein
MPKLNILDPKLWKGWSIGLQNATALYEHLKGKEYKTILDVGSGSTTLLFNYLGFNTITLEHDHYWARETEKLLENHGIKGNIVLADLKLTSWGYVYDAEPPENIDFCLIDGPPEAFGRQAMFYYIQPYLSENFEVWLDDCTRPIEAEALKNWQKDFNLKLTKVNYRITSLTNE